MSRLEYFGLPCEDDYATWLDLLHVAPSAQLLQRLGDFLEDYLREKNLSCYVLGVSGGIDSGFLAALLHARAIPFQPFSLVIQGNRPEEAERAAAICRAYGPTGASVPCLQTLTPLYDEVSSFLGRVFPGTTPIAEGNLKARMRMVFLYHAAQLLGGCVLSTDQLDEFLTGFWTLHGDVGDVSPLQVIPKTTEYALAGLLCESLKDPGPLRATIAATPTDGLGITPSDLDQLAISSYSELEGLFEEYFQLNNRHDQGISLPNDQDRLDRIRQTTVIKRFESTPFKRQGPMVFNPL
ncbi:NAD(+) synthase [Desulfoplanes sp.]